jgi:hypothetical protein
MQTVILPCFLPWKSLTSTISRIIVESMIIIRVMLKKSILLFRGATVSSISVCFPMCKGAIKFRILPINRKVGFTTQLLAKDGEVSWCILATYLTIVFWAVLMMMTSNFAIMAYKVVVWVSLHYGDLG